MKSQQMTVLLKKMIQVSQWRKRHRCDGRRLCKKADTLDDGDANVADNVIDVAHADADVAEVTEADVVYDTWITLCAAGLFLRHRL